VNDLRNEISRQTPRLQITYKNYESDLRNEGLCKPLLIKTTYKNSVDDLLDRAIRKARRRIDYEAATHQERCREIMFQTVAIEMEIKPNYDLTMSMRSPEGKWVRCDQEVHDEAMRRLEDIDRLLPLE
jgi:hypothetical protein